MLNGSFWLFSPNGIEKLEKTLNEWVFIEIPFEVKLLPFQFVSPYSET